MVLGVRGRDGGAAPTADAQGKQRAAGPQGVQGLGEEQQQQQQRQQRRLQQQQREVMGEKTKQIVAISYSIDHDFLWMAVHKILL